MVSYLFLLLITSYTKINMKKSLGILRNKSTQFQKSKQQLKKKKNRFHCVGRQQELSYSSDTQMIASERLTTSTSQTSSQQTSEYKQIYKKAKSKIDQVTQIKKLIEKQAKARLSSVKESEHINYDNKISKLANQATNNLVSAQKLLKLFSLYEPFNDAQRKFIRNMQLSLAQQIRQASKNLRNQQKQYFDRVHMYEKNTVNHAIYLSEQQKKNMYDECEMVEEMDVRNEVDQINELVKSINKLSHIYKELNNLVIEQGSLIDRIDFNIDETYQHTKKANQHLIAADEQAGSKFADRCIWILIVLIIVVALILGFKYSN